MAEQVECDRCGKQVRLRRDDTYSEHGWTRMGTKFRCEHSGRSYSRHMGEFRIIKRDPNLWLAECRCGETWLGDEYDDVERPWLEHAEAAKKTPAVAS